ncbi:Hypothetical predicted protein [Paramuricea clavata]|uniref:Gfd2/YDR514C-like C-terminal domain-containing protein n=1 Tax=Paramuricea clavata TaxID=317549 RepID=A0A7D9DRX6_PARCT|nr:Hypothetical predicted protein [Paramuricea clavata]
MRKKWIDFAMKKSDETGRKVLTYLNMFVPNSGGFSFTITQLYDELFHVCVTTEQYLKIKRELEEEFDLELPVVREQGLLSGGARQEERVRNNTEFSRLREEDLVEMNKPIIKRKHEEAQDHFALVENAFSIQDQKDFLAFDSKAYEHDYSKVLEIGYVIVRFSRHGTEGNLPKAKVINRKHLIIEENLHLKNKDNVPDNGDEFKFGVSETLSQEDAVERFREGVRGSDYLLQHSVKHDDAYLRNIGVDLSVRGNEMFYTQVVQTYKGSLIESEKYFMCSLSFLMGKYLGYQERNLQNAAGSKAIYTMMAFLRQMGYSAEEVKTIIAS